jgi:hypothetical protein
MQQERPNDNCYEATRLGGHLLPRLWLLKEQNTFAITQANVMDGLRVPMMLSHARFRSHLDASHCKLTWNMMREAVIVKSVNIT